MSAPDYVTIKFGPRNRYELHIPANTLRDKTELRQLFESLSADIARRQIRNHANQRQFDWATTD